MKAPARSLAAGLCALLVSACALLPFYWAVNTSLQPPARLFEVRYIPAPASLESYRSVLANTGFRSALLNSALAAGGTVALSLAAGALAGCALGRFRFAGRGAIFHGILAMTAFPQIAILGGLYQVVQAAGLYNRVGALVLSNLLFTLPFAVWVLSGFFASLPRELEESAMVDGATPLQTFLRVLLPLAAPGLVTVALLSFIGAWNEYLFALTLTIDAHARTVPVAIAQFSGESQREIPWGPIMAACVVVTLPLVALALLGQRRLVAGLTAGAVKG